MNQIKLNLTQKMKDQYGDIVSNMSTVHFLLYKIVVDLLETKYSNEE
jgi:hypothetical protein